jgi:hypothetical protein
MAAESIETNGILWIVDENGRISYKKGEYKEHEAPQLVPLPEMPDVPSETLIKHTLNGEVIFRDTPNEELSKWWTRYEHAEQTNDLYAQHWKKMQELKLRKIKCAYRKQKINEFILRILGKDKTR